MKQVADKISPTTEDLVHMFMRYEEQNPGQPIDPKEVVAQNIDQLAVIEEDKIYLFTQRMKLGLRMAKESYRDRKDKQYSRKFASFQVTTREGKKYWRWQSMEHTQRENLENFLHGPKGLFAKTQEGHLSYQKTAKLANQILKGRGEKPFRIKSKKQIKDLKDTKKEKAA